MEKIKVAAVSYLNTKPLLYGLEHHPLQHSMDLTVDYPAKVARQLKDGSVDMGLVPVAILPQLKEYHLVSDFCIGCDGEVASVCIFSEVPIEEVTSVLLDYQSRTSVKLATVLLREYWKSDAKLVPAQSESFREEIKGTTAGLVIGDRAFEQRLVSEYIYDLGAAWKDHTGLPFVFATWVSNKLLPQAFVDAFNTVTHEGMQHMAAIAAANPYPSFDVYEYFTKYISYPFDAEKKKGLALFLEKIAGYPAG